MIGRIEVGRYGFRGANAAVSKDPNAVVINCTKLANPPCLLDLSTGKMRSKSPPVSLERVKSELLEHQEHATRKLVQAVVEGVVAGSIMCVRCRLGKHRSQAVASFACEELAAQHPSVPFVGPLYLGGIKKTE